VVAIHMLLSGDLGRMGYLLAPAFAVAFSLVLTHHPLFQWLRDTRLESTDTKLTDEKH
jgi:hypothetical protein